MHKVKQVFDELNEVARLSMADPLEAMRRLSSQDFHYPELMWIRACIMQEAARNLAGQVRPKESSEFTEFDVHRAFWDGLKQLLPNAVRVKGPASDGVNIPDGWVEVDGELAPVEMKRDVFNGSARSQLQRYMRAYGTQRGVAVCPEFRCETDPSIVRVICRPPLKH